MSRPISFEEMHRLVLTRRDLGLETTPNNETWKLWGYSSAVDCRQRDYEFDKWLEETHRLRWLSTGQHRLYVADDVKKPFSSFDPST